MNGFLASNLKMFPQECSGQYLFSGKVYMTRGFISEFKEAAGIIAAESLERILLERAYCLDGADYLQVFEYCGVHFWVIDDVDHVTVLMPEEY